MSWHKNNSNFIYPYYCCREHISFSNCFPLQHLCFSENCFSQVKTLKLFRRRIAVCKLYQECSAIIEQNWKKHCSPVLNNHRRQISLKKTLTCKFWQRYFLSVSQGGSSSPNMTAKWSIKLNNNKKKTRWDFGHFAAFLDEGCLKPKIIQTDSIWKRHQIKLQTKNKRFTMCSHRRQRWSRSAGVQDTGRGRASAGGPARPGRPERPWPPWSWGRPDWAVISPLRKRHPHRRCPNHADEAWPTGGA